jgi:hypothetical protein
VLGLLAAGWMLGVSPEREKATKLDAEVSAAQGQLATVQSQLAEAQGARAQYATAYASVVRLGKAVPADQQVPSLVYELDQASNAKDVEFNSISSGSGSGASSTAAASPAAAAASGGFTQMPFTFVFRGSFVDLYHLFNQVQGFTVHTTKGAVQVSGRLLTIQGASLALQPKGGEESSKGSKPSAEEELTGTITATAYVLPAGQGVTGGATPAGPAGAGGAQPVSGSTPSSSTTAPPAVVRTP